MRIRHILLNVGLTPVTTTGGNGRLCSDRENLEFAGNSAKRRKIREFPFKYIINKKEKLRSPFLPFFTWKNKTFFLLSTIYKIYFLNCISLWGDGPNIKEAKYKFEFASKIS